MLDRFQAHLILMRDTLEDGDFSSFRNIKELIRFQEIQSPDAAFVSEHIASLLEGFSKYFNCPDSVTFDWLRNPFNAKAPVSFTYEEKKDLIDMNSMSWTWMHF